MRGRRMGIVLWIIALVVMLGAARHQRTTGPTYPLTVAIEIDSLPGELVLPRSGTTDAPAVVHWPSRVLVRDAWIEWRRYPTQDDFARIDFEEVPGSPLRAQLPVQPPAGKIEYRVRAESFGDTVLTFPADVEAPIMRSKDPVPPGVLIPHVAMMFLSMLFGVRAALAATFGRPETRWLVPTTAIGLTLGGMILGPIVQKFAFGAFWTGWPHGGDLTDNKTLVMWIGWVVLAAAFVVLPRLRPKTSGRLAILLVTLVMLVVYLIPHSLRGSQLDYDALEAGADPHDAIRTGGP